MRGRTSLFVCALAVAALLLATPQAGAVVVDVELSLVVDVSGDGIENVVWYGEIETKAARDRALTNGIDAIVEMPEHSGSKPPARRRRDGPFARVARCY